MDRRNFFSSAVAAVGSLMLVPKTGSADPFVPYIKPTNKKSYVFVRESEAQWLTEATKLANSVSQDFRQVVIGPDGNGVPYIMEAKDGDD